MREIFTSLLLIPGFILFFACSKHNSHPAALPADSTASNAYLDPGNFYIVAFSDSLKSFNGIHAYDTGGVINIMAKALNYVDTFVLSLSFADTLQVNTPYVNYITTNRVVIGSDTFSVKQGAEYFSLGFSEPAKAIIYLSGVNNNFLDDTLLITTLDKAKHQVAGTFTATMTATSSQNPYMLNTSTYITGAFNTYYNTAK